MSEAKVESKYIDKDPPMGTEQQLERKNNDYLAYLKEKLNFILATYGRRLTDADGHVNELIRTAAEFAIRLSQKVNGDEIISAINVSPEQITISANRISLNGTTIVNGKIIASYTKTYQPSDYTSTDMDNIRNYILGTGTLTEDQWDRYDLNCDGSIKMSDFIIVRNMINGTQGPITKTITTTIDPSSGKAINTTTVVSGLSGGDATYTATYDAIKADVQRVTAQYIYPLKSSKYIADFVVEIGESNGWYYRKWNNNLCECWYTIPAATKTFSAWGTVFASQSTSAVVYPVIFASRPWEIAEPSIGSNSVWLDRSGANTTTQSATYEAIRPVSGSANFGIDLYVIGKMA